MNWSLLGRANELAAAGRPEALGLYRHVLAHDPDCADAANNLGVLLHREGADAEAAGYYRQALRAAPDHADACNNLGRALLDLGSPDEAVSPLRKAVAHRACAERLHTLGRALQATDALTEARDCYRAALRQAPDSLESTNNLANVLLGLGKPQQALALLDAALTKHPDSAEVRYNRALTLLLLGRMADGWREYEARWQARGFPSPARDFGLPRWTGAPAPDAVLLLHWEQGLGDTIQFSRYVTLARQRVGRVVLLVQQPLRRLLDGLADAVIAEGSTLPQADFQAPLLSLPHLLNCPHPPPPALPQVPVRARGTVLQAGLVWAGNPAHSNDRNRSLPPGALAPLLAVPGVEFRNLQLGPRRAELPGSPFAPADFAATAELVRGLDLVIAVDTALAHLAASLGVPTWLLLPFAPDWRWGAQGRATPWYPAMRLFRQGTAGDWGPPVRAAAAALRVLTSR